MNAHEIIEAVLADAGERGALFPPLNDEGQSVLLADAMTPILLTADPDAEDSLFFSLSTPLLSLEGASDDVQLTFLWRLADESASGALPPGYVFFSNSEDLSLSLGGQFSAHGLELVALETLTDEFYRLAQVLREELSERLKKYVESVTEGPEPAPPDSFEPERLLRV